LLTWILVIFAFGVLIIVHEAGHLIAAKRAGIAVEVFSVGMGRRLFGKKIGETDYRVSLIPFGGYCKLAGEDPDEAQGREYEFGSKPVGYRFWVVAAGSLTNYIFAFILFSIVFMMGVPTLSNEVGELLENYPAEKAGIRVGDRILSINARSVEYWDDIVALISEESKKEDVLNMEVQRGERTMNIAVRPEISEIKNIFGQTISRPMVGIAPESKILAVSYGPLKAVYYGGRRLIVLTGMTYKGIWLILTGGMPLKGSGTGPIGIAFIMRQAANMGIVPFLLIMAHISMALAIFNLLPFPVLDGGHILFLGIEKVRGRALSAKVQEVITQVALLLILAFAIFICWQDILRFTPLGK